MLTEFFTGGGYAEYERRNLCAGNINIMPAAAWTEFQQQVWCPAIKELFEENAKKWLFHGTSVVDTAQNMRL